MRIKNPVNKRVSENLAIRFSLSFLFNPVWDVGLGDEILKLSGLDAKIRLEHITVCKMLREAANGRSNEYRTA